MRIHSGYIARFVKDHIGNEALGFWLAGKMLDDYIRVGEYAKRLLQDRTFEFSQENLTPAGIQKVINDSPTSWTIPNN
jgi:hypothetical protein